MFDLTPKVFNNPARPNRPGRPSYRVLTLKGFNNTARVTVALKDLDAFDLFYEGPISILPQSGRSH
jgi:hypothetical protein